MQNEINTNNKFNDLDDQKLDKLIELEEENSNILRKMRRSQRIQNTLRVLYWLFLIGLALGAYYFLKPTINSLKDFYSGFTGTRQPTSSINLNILNQNDLNTVRELLNRIRN